MCSRHTGLWDILAESGLQLLCAAQHKQHWSFEMFDLFSFAMCLI